MFDNAYAVYPYGSRVYGTYSPKSDYDYIVISDEFLDGEIIQGNNNYKCMSPSHFQKLLDEHNILALECLFLPAELIIKRPLNSWQFKLNLQKLRHSISSKVSHSWVKAKKKLESPYSWATDEVRRGQKSLFHSFRILDYGIQIATHGNIKDYSASNYIFEDIMSDTNINWDNYFSKWKDKHNLLSSEFRKLCPKD